MSKFKKIAQIGSFDVENYGDLLFPFVLKHKLSNYKIDLFSPNGGRMPFNEEIIVYKAIDLEKKIIEEGYDALIIGGGDVLRLDSSILDLYKNNMSPAMSFWLNPILLAKKYHIKVIFNAVGVPFRWRDSEKRILYQLLKDVDYLSVRGNHSKMLLEECGLKNVKVIPDTVLNISQIVSLKELKEIKLGLERRNIISSSNRYIVIQHNQYNSNNIHYVNEFKKLISLITDKYNYDVLLMPIGYVHHDIRFLEKLKMDDNIRVNLIEDKLSPMEMLSILANSSGYIGTSMHGAITTYAYQKPIMMINTKRNYKREDFLEIIGKKELEVKSVFELCKIFEESFLKEKVNNLKLLNNKINKHFSNISAVIECDQNKCLSNFEVNVLGSCLNEISKLEDEVLNKFKVYYYNDGYSEDNMDLVDVYQENNRYWFCLYLNKEISELRIDPFEGKIIRYQSIKVKADGVEIPCQVIDSYYNKEEELSYIYSLDPQVIINGVPSHTIKIEFEMIGSVVSYEELFMKYNQKMRENSQLSIFDWLKKFKVNNQ